MYMFFDFVEQRNLFRGIIQILLYQNVFQQFASLKEIFFKINNFYFPFLKSSFYMMKYRKYVNCLRLKHLTKKKIIKVV